MNNMTVEHLRTLIQLMSPLQTFIQELEKNQHLEMISGTTRLAYRNYTSIQQTVANILDTPYVHSLVVDEDAESDAAMATQLLLASKQLLSHLQSVTGVGSLDGSRYSIQTAPHIIINAQNASDKSKEELFKMIRDVAKDDTPNE